MADQEVIKHGKKLLGIWGKKDHPFLHKAADLVVEIFIIVFAVSISIGFHNWNANKHEQAQVKAFLLGLKKDIRADINASKENLLGYKNYDTTYCYLSSLRRDKVPNNDSLKHGLSNLNSSISLKLHKSRFTGFLSAGKIMSIENDSLALNILNYYQDVVPSLQLSEGGWGSSHYELVRYLTDNVKDVDSDMAKWEVLTTPKGRYLTKSLIPWQQLLDRYQAIIVMGEAIIKQIDELYPEEAALKAS